MGQEEPSAVIHAYNPGYFGSKDKEDHSLRLAWAKSLQDHLNQ
jgi:hypothetical protein